MTEARPRQAFRPRSTPAIQQRKVRLNSGMSGAMPISDSAARDEQGKAGRSDIDGNDANRRFIAAIEIRHACRTLPHTTRLRLEAGPVPDLPHFTWRISSNGRLALSSRRKRPVWEVRAVVAEERCRR